MDRLDKALMEFKTVLAEERGKRGRDFVRAKPQGLLLDALDAGAPDTSHDAYATGRRPACTCPDTIAGMIVNGNNGCEMHS